ncbi:putative Coagulation factor XI [Hypsibius exemplaris]|uniref:Coagulation factor XI n=1 Tax=Hypsibius exemplaris TaxID=2072580 RepID=A0A1W0WS16_HYPEX|nr:putative Coagulation factor XI [Hypsibius exemplaris]
MVSPTVTSQKSGYPRSNRRKVIPSDLFPPVCSDQARDISLWESALRFFKSRLDDLLVQNRVRPHRLTAKMKLLAALTVTVAVCAMFVVPVRCDRNATSLSHNDSISSLKLQVATLRGKPNASTSESSTRSGRFLEDDEAADTDSLDQDDLSTRSLNSSANNATSPDGPEGRSFFDDLPISPLGGYKKYEKAYINIPGYQASKEKVEGAGLMPSPVPVPGMVNVPYLTAPGGGFLGPVGYPQSGPVGYGQGGPTPYYSGPAPLQSYNVGPSPYLNNGPPSPYGPYPSPGFYSAPPPQPVVVARPVNVVPAPPVGFPIAGNSELGNFVSAIRNRPHGPPVNSRPLPPHCTCKKLADCRDVSRFARMYTDDDVSYNGQCLPSFVVCCNPELLEQQKQALHPGPPPPRPVVVAQPNPPVVPVVVKGVVPYGKGPNGPPPPPIGGPVCGRKGTNPMARVLDETVQRADTEFGEYPWMAAVLLSDLTYVCGGALIGNRFILTAAHCISKHKHRNLIVRLGEYDVQETSEPPFQDYKVVDAIIHAGYHSGTLRNDMAVLVLDAPVKFNAYIAPVCLPEPGASYGPALCTVTGWGKNTIAHGKWSSRLKGVDVPLVTNEFCENSYRKSPELGGYFNLDNSFVCAGAPGKDACFGDGGSPMVCPINGVYQLVGLVSWGIDCGLYPGVYARVDKFLPWIADVTRQFS